MPEIIDPVFAKTSPKRSFSVIQNERFGLVFVKTWSINSGTGKSNLGVLSCQVTSPWDLRIFQLKISRINFLFMNLMDYTYLSYD